MVNFGLKYLKVITLRVVKSIIIDFYFDFKNLLNTLYVIFGLFQAQNGSVYVKESISCDVVTHLEM